jgi:CHAD domain-containing protein
MFRPSTRVMAFRIKRKEATTEALRRVARECVAKALGDLRDSESLEAVHSVRKEIKKLRALLRLVRASVDRGFYRKGAGDLREAARHLSQARDAQAALQTIRDLIDLYRGELAARAFEDIMRALRRRCLEEAKRFRQQSSASHASRSLRNAGRRFEKIAPRRKGWPALGAGLRNTYSSSRKAYQQALAEPTPENLHAWRKRVKDLWYQLRLLCRVWPEELEARAKELKALSDYLGGDHDLVMMKGMVQDLVLEDGQAKEMEALCGLVKRRQDKLRRKATKLGARFFLEKDSRFCQRIEGYWDIWRKRKGFEQA